ncbi:hypothetical protein ACCO45_005127 [Purpureocillium lilacinum]|uniref:Uncharacterized protein n=1 Tax=Purpureocillium lilacinum TaxID=33203 RepID=A0ACC4DUK4_PURLI
MYMPYRTFLCTLPPARGKPSNIGRARKSAADLAVFRLSVSLEHHLVSLTTRFRCPFLGKLPSYRGHTTASDLHMRHQLPTTTTPVTMIHKDSSLCNMGRGAYDTTGVPKPPPRPQPR